LTTGATSTNLETEICSTCHPIYTGKKKTVDSTGRVDRFKKMAEKAQQKREQAQKTKEAKQKRESERTTKAQEEEKSPSKKKSSESSK